MLGDHRIYFGFPGTRGYCRGLNNIANAMLPVLTRLEFHIPQVYLRLILTIPEAYILVPLLALYCISSPENHSKSKHEKEGSDLQESAHAEVSHAGIFVRLLKACVRFVVSRASRHALEVWVFGLQGLC